MSVQWALALGILGAVAVALSARVFYLRQRKGALGGAISGPKAYWLGLVLYCWYLLGTLLIFIRPPLGLRTTFILASISVFLRAFIEAIMLWHTKNWRPAYGIAHNQFMLGLIVTSSTFQFLFGKRVEISRLDLIALLVWLLSVSMELYHAVAFSKVAGHQTTGDDAIWFADATSPRFAAINRITSRNNALLTLAALLCLVSMSSHTSLATPLAP